MKPTAEQQVAIDLFRQQDDGKIQALAGAGKTQTLIMLAQSDPGVRGQLIVFNKSAKEDAARRLPSSVRANTAHSLAYGAIGKEFRERLGTGGARMRNRDLGLKLGIKAISVTYEGKTKVLGVETLTLAAVDAIRRFCQSADPEPTERHVAYIDGIDQHTADGKRGYTNNNMVARHLAPTLRIMWADLTRTDGWMPYGPKGHAYYLKLWQLSNPRVNSDYILVDEAQDISPVMMSAIAAQTNCQIVWTGDSNQEIYGWNGAIDALTHARAAWETPLTESWRFGEDIAAEANLVLARIGTPLRLRGSGPPGRVGLVNTPDAILCRTNAVTLERLMNREGRSVHIVGGGTELKSFAYGAQELQDNGKTGHHELACFDHWDETRKYVTDGEDGGDLKLMVTLIDRFGAGSIINALNHMPTEDKADVVVSTAHKAKGRQWASVQLASDFMPMVKGPDGWHRATMDELPLPELRLLYVAMTRAQTALDISRLAEPVDEEALA